MTKAEKSFKRKIFFLITALFLIIIGLFIIKSYSIKSLPQTGVSPQPEVLSQVRFNCDDKKTIDASFMPSQVKLSLSDDRELTLPIVVSASGSRYANSDESFVFWTKGLTAFVQEGQQTSYANCTAFQTPSASATNTVSTTGVIVCLPYKNQTGAQTMECAYGLKADNGAYYGLTDSDPMYKNISGVAMNTKVEVTGSISLQSDSKYDTLGTILVSSIKPI